MLLYQTLVLTIHRKTKKSYKNNKFKISPPTWNEEFELTDVIIFCVRYSRFL